MRVAALIVLIFAFTVFAQTIEFEDKLLLDSFTVESPTLIILIPTGGLSPDDPSDRKTQENYVQGASILGSERDLFLFVDSGEQNLVLTVGVSAGTYNSATPNEARGGSAVTLDGVDGDSSIDTTGLFGNANNDFTANDAFALHTFIETDQPTSVFFSIYSGNVNNYCSFEVEAPGDDTRREYIMRYADFDKVGTGCDWTNVGAFDITSIMFDNVDIIVEPVYTYGPVDTCVCECPVFSCVLNLDPDDDTYSYYVTSDFGVFNPTTDFSTDGNPPPPSSATSSPRPSGVSATPRPQSDSTTLTLSQTSGDSSTSRNTNSRNSNSQNSSSDASVLAYTFGVAILLVALLF